MTRVLNSSSASKFPRNMELNRGMKKKKQTIAPNLITIKDSSDIQEKADKQEVKKIKSVNSVQLCKGFDCTGSV